MACSWDFCLSQNLSSEFPEVSSVGYFFENSTAFVVVIVQAVHDVCRHCLILKIKLGPCGVD